MARYLTQKQIDEFRECFSLYDKKKQNKVDPIRMNSEKFQNIHFLAWVVNFEKKFQK